MSKNTWFVPFPYIQFKPYFLLTCALLNASNYGRKIPVWLTRSTWLLMSLVENPFPRSILENLGVLQLTRFTLETALNSVTISRV